MSRDKEPLNYPAKTMLYPAPYSCRSVIVLYPQSNELTKRDSSVSSALSFIEGVHIGARALLDINLIWFGYIARLFQWGGGGYFTRSNDFYLPSHAWMGRGGRGSALCDCTISDCFPRSCPSQAMNNPLPPRARLLFHTIAWLQPLR